MGGFASKDYQKNTIPDKEVRRLKEKIRHLREEINGVMHERKKETRENERNNMVFTLEEAEWKQERKELRQEVKGLRKMIEEKEEIIREMKLLERMVVERSGKELEFWEQNILMEKIREERAERDEAAQKWKQLYLDIKSELDELIQWTHIGYGLHCRARDKVEELKRELKAKGETIKALKAELDSKANENYKKERDVDILRQSLRIISSKKELQEVTHHPPIISSKGCCKLS